MHVARLWLTEVRNHEATDVELPDGLVVVTGDNGQGKTNLLESVGLCATLSSFRGAPTEALVRAGAERGVVRCEVVEQTRRSLIEIELGPGRTRAQLNRQPLRRTRDLLGLLRVTVFGPDDLELVKGSPGGRRRYLDDLLVACQPRNDELRRDVDRVLKQRSTLLKQAGPRADEAALATLDVWDAKLAELGTELARRRRALVAELGPRVDAAYRSLVEERGSAGSGVVLGYDPDWLDEGLDRALERLRTDELRRGVSLVGPHRDDLDLVLDDLPSRTHASQGEQRSLALALRLAGHEVVAERTGTPPVVLLDDVLSELDPWRSRALLSHLPDAQVVISTAGPIPDGITPALVLRVDDGRVVERSDPVGDAA
ncbi:MAG: DNA replication/repair protein RecF [Actinomycetota bacterium]